MKKIEFRHHFNYDPDDAFAKDSCDERSKVQPGMVLPRKEMLERYVHGNIVDKFIDGIYPNEEDIDSVDLEEFSRLDITERGDVYDLEVQRIVDNAGKRKLTKEENERIAAVKKQQELDAARKFIAENSSEEPPQA